MGPPDVLRSIIEVEPSHDKRERHHHGLHHRQQEHLFVARHGTDHLKLGDLIHRIDEVAAFDPVSIALMHTIMRR